MIGEFVWTWAVVIPYFLSICSAALANCAVVGQVEVGPELDGAVAEQRVVVAVRSDAGRAHALAPDGILRTMGI